MSSPAKGLTPIEISSLSAVAFRRYQQGLPITDASPLAVVSSIAISSSNGNQLQQSSPTPHSVVGELEKEISVDTGAGEDAGVQMKEVEAAVAGPASSEMPTSSSDTNNALAALHFTKKKSALPLFSRPPSKNGDEGSEIDELEFDDANAEEGDAQALAISSIVTSMQANGSQATGAEMEKKKDSKKRNFADVNARLEENVVPTAPLASTSTLPIPATARLTAKKPNSTTSSSTSTSAKKAAHPTPSAQASAETSSFGSIPLPHYTVTYTTPNNKENPHVIRINDGVTDGLKSRWPTLGKVDSNWYDMIPIGEGRALGWQIMLGKEMAERLEIKRTTAGKSPRKLSVRVQVRPLYSSILDACSVSSGTQEGK